MTKSMTEREFFVKTVEDEIPRFDRVFKSLPDTLEDLKHHPKNRSAMEIIQTMAGESTTFTPILKTGVIDFSKLGNLDGKTVSALAQMFKKSMEEADEMAKGMSEDDWNSKAAMMSGDKVEWETTKGNMAWGLVLDQIHHRGQLSTYIRPHGGKVPSIYGPSGDMES